jgi:hypothetical protein
MARWTRDWTARLALGLGEAAGAVLQSQHVAREKAAEGGLARDDGESGEGRRGAEGRGHEHAGQHEGQDMGTAFGRGHFAGLARPRHVDEADIAGPLQRGAPAREKFGAAGEVQRQLEMVDAAGDMLRRAVEAQGARPVLEQDGIAEMPGRGGDMKIRGLAEHGDVADVARQLAETGQRCVARLESGGGEDQRGPLRDGNVVHCHGAASKGRGRMGATAESCGGASFSECPATSGKGSWGAAQSRPSSPGPRTSVQDAARWPCQAASLHIRNGGGARWERDFPQALPDRSRRF